MIKLYFRKLNVPSRYLRKQNPIEMISQRCMKDLHICSFLVSFLAFLSPFLSFLPVPLLFHLFEPTSWHAIWWSKYMPTHTPCGFTPSPKAAVLKSCELSLCATAQIFLLCNSCLEEVSNFNQQTSQYQRRAPRGA